MSTEMQTILSFCLKHAGLVPMHEQAFLYRALAEFCGDKTDAALFCRMAGEIESAEKARGQLSFKWAPKKSTLDGDGNHDGHSKS